MFGAHLGTCSIF